MELTGQQIFEFLSHHGYWIILPLMLIEGPVTTLMAAMLASLGALNVWAVLVLSIIGDIAGDVGLYGIGRKWGLSFSRRIGKYIGITEKRVLKMEKYFDGHGGKTIFLAKSTTGLCLVTFVAAGIAGMKFKKFLFYSFLGGIIWSGFLVAMGYFYGYFWREIRQYIEWAGWIAIGLAVASFIIVNLYKSQRGKRIFKNNNFFLTNKKK